MKLQPMPKHIRNRLEALTKARLGKLIVELSGKAPVSKSVKPALVNLVWDIFSSPPWSDAEAASGAGLLVEMINKVTSEEI